MSIRRKIFYSFTVTVVMVLLVLPATAWIARVQLLPFTLPCATRNIYGSRNERPGEWDADVQKALATHPGNVNITYAYALSDQPSDLKSEIPLRLDMFGKSHPNNPTAVAALLKYRLRYAVDIRRSELSLLLPPQRRVLALSGNLEPSDPQQIAEFIQLARTGEYLEPDNAFFTMMTAFGYFAAKDDDKAIAAWIRAGDKTQWNDYTSEDIVAWWKLQCALNNDNETGTIARMTLKWAMEYGHYARIRALARMATVKAMQAELWGDRETGFRIRKATRQIGQNMEAHGTVFVANRVGATIVATAMYRTAGEEMLPEPEGNEGSAKQWQVECMARYVRYLQSIGHPEEGIAFTEAIVQGHEIERLQDQGSGCTYNGSGTKLQQLTAAWYTNYLLSAATMFSLTFAGIFKTVYKFSPRLQKGEPLQTSAQWGVAVGLCLPLLGIVGLITVSNFWLEPVDVILAVGSLSIAALVAPPLLMRWSWRELGHGFLVIVATTVVLAILLGVGVIGERMMATVSYTWALSSLGDIVDGSPQISDINWSPFYLILSMPLGLLAAFGVCSKLFRIPVAVGITRGMRALAVPLACFLALLWSASLLNTAKHERAAIAELEQMATIGEAQYVARLLGKPFPSGVRSPEKEIVSFP